MMIKKIVKKIKYILGWTKTNVYAFRCDTNEDGDWNKNFFTTQHTYNTKRSEAGWKNEKLIGFVPSTENGTTTTTIIATNAHI